MPISEDSNSHLAPIFYVGPFLLASAEKGNRLETAQSECLCSRNAEAWHPGDTRPEL